MGYGWLDATWGGDAEILLAVDASAREQGVGSFVIGHLEDEAASRGLNYVYNTVRDSHPDRDDLHDWLAVRGYRGSTSPGEDTALRKRVGADRERRSATAGSRRRPSPHRHAKRTATTRRARASAARVTRSPAATSTSTTTGTDPDGRACRDHSKVHLDRLDQPLRRWSSVAALARTSGPSTSSRRSGTRVPGPQMLSTATRRPASSKTGAETPHAEVSSSPRQAA